jgi:hypothetical protein
MPISNTVTTYGNVSPRLLKRPPTLEDPKFQGLAYPVPLNPKNGYFSKASNLDLIKSNLSSLIKTQRGERFMRPDLGCNLKKFLMEPLDEGLFSLIKEEVVTAITCSAQLGTLSLRLLILELESNGCFFRNS